MLYAIGFLLAGAESVLEISSNGRWAPRQSLENAIEGIRPVLTSMGF